MKKTTKIRLYESRKLTENEEIEEIDATDIPAGNELTDVVEPTPDLPNEINVTWKLSDDLETVMLTAITINGKPIEGVEDPEASIRELAGFSSSLDIDEDRLLELIAEKNLSEDTDAAEVTDALPAIEPMTESVEYPRYATRHDIKSSAVWKWATGQA